ncbi:MAG: carboxypeptidase regulatory-like domain-containing protein [Saprospiraceae bacterium]|nr:carboxypeptidase regulatory-like domain-containing protein [Saprospiraceae bacterium]
MGLHLEYYSLLRQFLPISFLFIILGSSKAQSSCTVRVAEEPIAVAALAKPTKADQIIALAQKEWLSIDKSMVADDAHARVVMDGQYYSSTLSLTQLGFNLPQGATILGIKVNLEGRRQGNGTLKEFSVRLVSGNAVSANMAGKGYNAMNVWAKNSTDKKWSYGFADHLWGINWTAAMINDPSFGLQIQLINFSTQSVEAMLDGATIEVTYLPLATFCLTDVFSVYVDQRPDGCKYMWQVPQGFEWTSKSTNNYIVDFKASYAQPGIYPFCVDIYGYQNEYLGSCCRDIRIRNCTPSTLGNFVWNDINYNGIQDSGEPGIKDVKVELYNSDNVLVQTVTTNASGQYLFTNITEASYYIIVKLPADYVATISNSNDLQNNSDFISGNNRTETFFLPFGSNRTDVDFGLVKKLKIGDFVWEDLNYNGIQDGGEPGIANVVVKLYNGAGTLVQSVVSDANGKYSFDNVPAAQYELEFVAGSSYLPTRVQQGSAAVDSDIQSNGRTGLINMQNTSVQTAIDAGFYRLGSIGDFVWNDLNNDGKQSPQEPGTPDLTLYLLNELGQVIDTTTTNASGQYLFNALLPGQYKVKIILPLFTEPTQLLTGPGSSKLETVNGMFVSRPVTLISNQNVTDNDLGYIEINSAVGGYVFRDFNNNGARDNNEPGIPAIEVTLIRENLQVVSTITTGNDGFYQFDNLQQGGYFISCTIADTLQFTDADAATDDIDSDILDRIGTGFTNLIDLLAGDSLTHFYAGVCRRSCIGDRVWRDADYNGVQDTGESGLEGIVVTLNDEAGSALDQTTTDVDGKYNFENLPVGHYQIQVSVPQGSIVTRIQQGAPSLDSDISPDGLASDVVLPLGIDNKDVDAGLTLSLELGDFVWEDINYNGLQDTGEPGIEGVAVKALDASGNLLAETLTGADGKYLLSQLPSIDMELTFEVEDPFKATQSNISDPTTNSDINNLGSTGLITLAGQSSNKNIDAGLYRESCIGDFIWLDQNGNGIQDTDDRGLWDVMVVLYNEAGIQQQIYFSNETGRYEFCGLKPGNYYLTAQPVNGYFPTLAGLGSVLQDAGNGEYKTAIFTLVSGNTLDDLDLGFVYRPQSKVCGIVFSDENADGRFTLNEPGIYNAKVEIQDVDFNFVAQVLTNEEGKYCFEEVLPGSYYFKFSIGDSLQFTTANIGTDDADSDAEGTIDIGITSLVAIQPATDINHVFAGTTYRSTIAGFAWFDFAKDGLRGGTEPGISGISIELLDEAGLSLASTTTGSDPAGYYSFDKLPRGNYKIKFQTNPNFEFTIKGVDPINGSYANADGVTDVLTALPNEDLLTINGGYAFKGGGIEGTAWKDLNKNKERDPDDDILSLVNVHLYDGLGQLLQTTQTDFSGSYSFFPVNSGLYYVVFDTFPELSFVKPDPLFLNSDVNHENGRGSTRYITVVNGTIEAGIDAGYYDIQSYLTGTAWEDRNGNGTLEVTDTVLRDIKVRLWSNGMAIDSTLTDENGLYLLGPLLPGKYRIQYVNTDSNYTITYQHVAGLDTLLDSDINAEGFTDTILVGECLVIGGINGGYRGFGKMEGEGFVDENENGLNDEGIEALNDIQVSLIDPFDNVVASDTTREINGEQGRFAFEKIPAGNYRMRVKRPLFYVFTLQNTGGGSQEDIDSDVLLNSNTYAFSDPIGIRKDETVDDQDFGLVFRTPAISSIRGQVWTENIIDGQRAVGELPVQGMTMGLYKSDDSLVKQTTTDAEGKYLFDQLIEGFYYVKAELAAGKTYTFYKEGSDFTIDSDFSDEYRQDATLLFYLGISADTMALDLGVTEELQLGDFVWDDLNDNGLQDAQEPGLTGVKVSVVRNDNKVVKTTTTDGSGKYQMVRIPAGNYRLVFNQPTGYSSAKKQAGGSTIDSDINEDGRSDLFFYPAPAVRNDLDAGFVKNGSIGDFVWIDFNANGIQNSGEPGKDSVVINLYNDAGQLVKTTQSFTNMASGVQGQYIFSNVRPGSYFLEFITPSQYQIVPQDIGDDALDSDIDGAGVTPAITVLPGQVITHVDAGIFLPGCIGNFVWLDENKNGIQDIGEPGVSDVVVKLFKSTGSLVATGTTNEEGFYQFNDLAQGLYYSEFIVEAPYVFTLTDQGDETTDSDANANGQTPLISLAHGAKFFDLDAGIFIPTQLIQNAAPAAVPVEDPSLVIAPNPANFQTTLVAQETGRKMTLMDQSGKTIKTWLSASKNEVLDLRGLQAGIYFVVMESSGGRVQQQLIKMD